MYFSSERTTYTHHKDKKHPHRFVGYFLYKTPYNKLFPAASVKNRHNHHGINFRHFPTFPRPVKKVLFNLYICEVCSIFAVIKILTQRDEQYRFHSYIDPYG